MNHLCHCVSKFCESVGREHKLQQVTICKCSEIESVRKLIVLDENNGCAKKRTDNQIGEHNPTGMLSEKR